MYEKNSKAKPVRASKAAKKQKSAKAVPTPSTSDHDEEEEERDLEMSDLTDAEEVAAPILTKKAAKARTSLVRTPSGRATSRKKIAINYAEDDEDE